MSDHNVYCDRVEENTQRTLASIEEGIATVIDQSDVLNQHILSLWCFAMMVPFCIVALVMLSRYHSAGGWYDDEAATNLMDTNDEQMASPDQLHHEMDDHEANDNEAAGDDDEGTAIHGQDDEGNENDDDRQKSAETTRAPKVSASKKRRNRKRRNSDHNESRKSPSNHSNHSNHTKPQQNSNEDPHQHHSLLSHDELSDLRVRQRNLVYVVGLPIALCDQQTLRTKAWFGGFGEIKKVYCNERTSHPSPTGSGAAFITFYKQRDALRAIQSMNGKYLDDGNRIMKATTGCTKYCCYFLRGSTCSNPRCLYLHEWANEDDVVTKEERNDFGPIGCGHGGGRNGHSQYNANRTVLSLSSIKKTKSSTLTKIAKFDYTKIVKKEVLNEQQQQTPNHGHPNGHGQHQDAAAISNGHTHTNHHRESHNLSHSDPAFPPLGASKVITNGAKHQHKTVPPPVKPQKMMMRTKPPGLTKHVQESQPMPTTPSAHSTHSNQAAENENENENESERDHDQHAQQIQHEYSIPHRPSNHDEHDEHVQRQKESPPRSKEEELQPKIEDMTIQQIHDNLDNFQGDEVDAILAKLLPENGRNKEQNKNENEADKVEMCSEPMTK